MKRLSIEKPHIYVKLSSLIRAGKLSVITGAGISTSGGIPDFRSKDGLFREIKETYGYSGEQIFTHATVHSSADAMRVFIGLMCALKEKLEDVAPTQTHAMLGYVHKKHGATVYTQNIDGLERKAGIEKNLVYLHGNLFTLICTRCLHTTEYTAEKNARLKAEGKVECPSCLARKAQREAEKKRTLKPGWLIPNIVLYGAHTDTLPLIKSIHQSRDSTLLLVMGTSLRVYGVKNLTKELSRHVTKNSGIKVYVGKESPPKSLAPYFDYWIEGECDGFSSRLLSALTGTYLLKQLKKISILKAENLLFNLRRLSLEPSELPK
ncbi:NAD+-dependent protein deacetylase SIR2 [Nematocida sp. AWRm77]|nr:NAD+-dependent protein deacetylase SIR2 [Nematocida sp. AWRm77]